MLIALPLNNENVVQFSGGRKLKAEAPNDSGIPVARGECLLYKMWLDLFPCSSASLSLLAYRTPE
jgi:hypothetical protein